MTDAATTTRRFLRGHLPGRNGLEQHAMPESWKSKHANRVMVGGSIANTPKLRYTRKAGRPYCLMLLRVRNRKTALVRTRAWGDQAIACAEWLVAGDEISVDGRFGPWGQIERQTKDMFVCETVIDVYSLTIVWSTRERMLRDDILLRGEEALAVDQRRRAGVEPVRYGDAVIPAETLERVRSEMLLFGAASRAEERAARKNGASAGKGEAEAPQATEVFEVEPNHATRSGGGRASSQEEAEP